MLGRAEVRKPACISGLWEGESVGIERRKGRRGGETEGGREAGWGEIKEPQDLSL